jgi:hypothetical protein
VVVAAVLLVAVLLLLLLLVVVVVVLVLVLVLVVPDLPSHVSRQQMRPSSCGLRLPEPWRYFSK